MTPPRSCTDLIICFPCPACNGMAGIGSHCKADFISCHVCAGTGWQEKRLPELTASQIQTLRNKLP